MDPPDPAERVLTGAAWRDFCARLAALGDSLLDGSYPSEPRDVAEGYRHLATQTIAWLSWAVGYSATSHPAFFRQNDLVVRWGGPNVDQTTRRARVEPDGIYRITGTMGTCEDFILTLKSGDMHRNEYGIASETMASELGIGPGDDVDLVISASPSRAPGSPCSATATLLNLREYYWDWRPGPPATFAITRLDTLGTAPERPRPEQLAPMLDEAAELIEASIPYWNAYVARERGALSANTMGPPRGAAGGSSRIAYSFGFFELGPEDALIIEADVTGARFWDTQLYSLGWFESLDFANRTTSINHTQGTVSADGRFRAVVARRDPGVANWLDCEDRPVGMVTHRWIAGTPHPAISSMVVPMAELTERLPAETPRVTPSQRAEERQRRQEHVAWRYRT